MGRSHFKCLILYMTKNIFTLIMGLLFGCTSGEAQERSSIHGLSYTSLTGEKIEMSAYKGKHILIVNVASKCGFTSQYEDMQKLHEQYKDELVVIGFPCNQFGGQEPGSASSIQTFCRSNFGVEFPMSEKIDVKGDNQHPIYQWLSNKEANGQSSSSVKWNFQKYLINPEGQLIDFFLSTTKPLSLKITSHLGS
jgi:glutathione peroxidase